MVNVIIHLAGTQPISGNTHQNLHKTAGGYFSADTDGYLLVSAADISAGYVRIWANIRRGYELFFSSDSSRWKAEYQEPVLSNIC